MTKRQIIEAITPGACVFMMLLCGWFGKKGRWWAVGAACVAWLIFATWMLYL